MTLLLAILGAVGCVLIGTGVLTLVGDRMAGRGAMPTQRARNRAWVRIVVGAAPMFAGIALVEGETGHRAEYVYFWWAGACVMALSGLFLVARLTSPPVRGRAGRWRGPFNVRRVAVTALVFAMLLCASWVVRSAPLMRDRGWWAPIPSWALLLLPSRLPDQVIGAKWSCNLHDPWSHTYRALGVHHPVTLVERADHGVLSDRQRAALIDELERRTIECGDDFAATALASVGGRSPRVEAALHVSVERQIREFCRAETDTELKARSHIWPLQESRSSWGGFWNNRTASISPEDAVRLGELVHHHDWFVSNAAIDVLAVCDRHALPAIPDLLIVASLDERTSKAWSARSSVVSVLRRDPSLASEVRWIAHTHPDPWVREQAVVAIQKSRPWRAGLWIRSNGMMATALPMR
ncbi:MAG: hypothetical protein KF768_05290 [Phycisphaeraceae bacterium]|nr:hypothetical protein [Phycisphaeraceae bacterium]